MEVKIQVLYSVLLGRDHHDRRPRSPEAYAIKQQAYHRQRQPRGYRRYPDSTNQKLTLTRTHARRTLPATSITGY